MLFIFKVLHKSGSSANEEEMKCYLFLKYSTRVAYMSNIVQCKAV